MAKVYKRVRKRIVWPNVKIDKEHPSTKNELERQRGWTGINTTLASDYVPIPVNKQALFEIRKSSPKKRGRKKTRVYVVRFKHATGLSFLKIGVTDTSIAQRFENDIGRFEIETIAQSALLHRKHALTFESALQHHFRLSSFRPPIPLRSGGNSECFNDNDEVIALMRDMIVKNSECIGVV